MRADKLLYLYNNNLGMDCSNQNFCFKRCPREMSFGQALEYCQAQEMDLPMPQNIQQNEWFTTIGASWINIYVNDLFGMCRNFGVELRSF